MAKRIPVDCRRLTPVHLANLDEDQLLLLAQRIEIQSQQLNRAMRMVIEMVTARQRASAA